MADEQVSISVTCYTRMWRHHLKIETSKAAKCQVVGAEGISFDCHIWNDVVLKNSSTLRDFFNLLRKAIKFIGFHCIWAHKYTVPHTKPLFKKWNILSFSLSHYFINIKIRTAMCPSAPGFQKHSFSVLWQERRRLKDVTQAF